MGRRPNRCINCPATLPPGSKRYCLACAAIAERIRASNASDSQQARHLPPAAKAEREQRVAAHVERIQLDLGLLQRRGRKRWQ
jgi:hypothetical protein